MGARAFLMQQFLRGYSRPPKSDPYGSFYSGALRSPSLTLFYDLAKTMLRTLTN
jgi:hypothetical protein